MSSGGDGDPTSDLVVVSGADSGYFPLLQDAVRSVRALRPEVAIGVFDLGLAPDERDWLEGRVTTVVRPQWDFDFPGRARASQALMVELARPFLPRYFPGYRMYL